MSGIIIDGKFFENSDLICKYCHSPVWEMELFSNFCLLCNQYRNDSDTMIQNQFYFPRVAIAYSNSDNEFAYLKDKAGGVIIFENQITAEIVLINHRMNPEDYYFIEVDYIGNFKKDI